MESRSPPATGNGPDASALLGMSEGDGEAVATAKPARSPIVGLLLVLALLLLLACLCLAAAVAYLQLSASSDCVTPDCIRTAATILNSMDPDVDPCDDFYAFACGKWVAEHPIPDDSASISNFENLGIEMEHLLKRLLLEKDDKAKDNSAGVSKAKAFFRMCLNESQIMGTWRDVFEDVVRRHHGWPALSGPSWSLPPGYLMEDLYGSLVAGFGVTSLFKFSVQADDKNSSAYVIMLDQPDLNLHAKDFYVEPKTKEEREAYLELVAGILRRLGADPLQAASSAQHILTFETALAMVTNKEEEEKLDIATQYTNLSLRDLATRFPNWDWARFFRRIFQEIPYQEASGKVGEPRAWDPDSTRVVTYGTKFWTGLNTLLEPGKHDRRVMVDYVMWTWFFKEMLRDLPEPFASALFKFYQRLQIRKVPKLRWHGCVQRTNQLFKWATARLYVHDNFDDAARHKVEMMIDMIMESFHTILEEEDWLTPETKRVAREKIEAIDRKVGYPDLVNSPDHIDRIYNDYKTYPGDYFRSKFSATGAEQGEQLGRLGSPINRTHWVSGAAVVNAFYSPNTNEIIIPMGILRPVFWSTAFPWSMNFGGIGVVIGHEITHGFDDRGRLYDKFGNIRQWWDNGTVSRFEEKAQCIDDQYSSYTLEQIGMKMSDLRRSKKRQRFQVSGKKTKGENIADNGGLKQAFMAYKRWVEEEGEEAGLPGVSLTHRQLFFLNYAQIWCGSMNDKEAVRKLKTAVHSPGPVRVKGPLSNSQEFAEAYNCPIGSPMNPSHKCRVW